MPHHVSPERPRTGVTKLTGCRVVRGKSLVQEDVWISSVTGKILHSQEVFYEHHVMPDEIVDLKGKVLAPGFIDVQFNGAFGFDFSTVPESDDMVAYHKGLKQLNRHLVRTGVTSYLPTLPSGTPDTYHKVLPYLGPSGAARDALEGSESLGAHCEGPFISPTKNGIHSSEVLREAPNGLADLEACYGARNIQNGAISTITIAPEVRGVAACIPELAKRGIKVAIGHTEATYEQATDAISQGVTMITHLFNAMRPLHHRNPGVFGVLGKSEPNERPYFGIISDGIHLHPTTVKIAWNAHPDGFILVTDAQYTAGLPDGPYPWTNGDRWVKKGALLTREGSDTIAGSSATLIECVSNFWTWSNASIPDLIRAVTTIPAEMLGLNGVKGSLDPDADADLIVLKAIEEENGGGKKMEIEQVWKFGVKVHDASAKVPGP